MSSEHEFKLRTTTEGVKEAVNELQDVMATSQQATTMLYGLLGILRKTTGSEEVAEAINNILRLIATLNMARTAIMAFYAASGPWGWVMAGIGAVSTAITVADQIAYEMRY